MMKQCVNNTIQKYMEEGIKRFDLKETDSLYEIYKDIRTTMAERGMILVKLYDDEIHTTYEEMLTNPKTIASSLLYVWILSNGYTVTQQDISKYFNIHTRTIYRASKILKKYIEDNKLELSIYNYEKKQS